MFSKTASRTFQASATTAVASCLALVMGCELLTGGGQEVTLMTPMLARNMHKFYFQAGAE